MRRFSTVVATGLLLFTAGALSAQTEISSRASRITVGGRLHTQYAASSVDPGADEFFFRRARLTADVAFTDFLDARIQPEFAGGSAELKDAYVRFEVAPELRLTMGQFKRAFDLFELSSSTDLSIIERDGRVEGAGSCAGVGGLCTYSRLTEKLEFSDRDRGLRVDGSRGRVEYEVSLTNGAGANTSDEEDGKSYSGRLAVEIADGVTLGGQLGVHDYVGPADESRHASAWAADVQVGSWRDGFLLQAAVVGGDNWKNPDAEGEPSTFRAVQGIASYYAPLSAIRLSGVEPLLRVSWGDPDTAAGEDGGLLFTPGLMLYVFGKNKIGLNVDVWSPEAGETEYSVKVQSFIYF